MVLSVLEDAGVQASSCGYCSAGADTSVSHGMWAHRLTVDDYQGALRRWRSVLTQQPACHVRCFSRARLVAVVTPELVDRGWRRSGSWLYRPCCERTCCPPYSIRLDVAAFVPSREHRRLQRRLSERLRALLDKARDLP